MNLFAYLDPGSGSLILQVIIGFVLGAGVLIKTYWSKIKGLFSKNKKSKPEAKKSAKSDTDSE
ncbi:MAG TPA: hypothetical protein VJJ78_00570 [Candidatus Saccharimonadales bacterium]|nr:hypothetical protein [Candidatus Saccharimonadales bacterium]